ncbi:hypothetical protein GCM10025883_04470 [Mobilicoccus caccae]|uniref:Probable cytosol aminopeptidase n=1 Tax=Mobilicoccus caccae TaxID=1859295 RepID=A0ABQ6IMI5_9MICO|nr:hypothetical protein GCM10025883_04470 [Mobilicoccus caccae]
MTMTSIQIPDPVILHREATTATRAHADVLVAVVARPATATDLPAWLAPYEPHLRELEEGEMLTVPGTSDSAFRARVLEVVVLDSPTHETARRAGRRIGAGHRGATDIAVTGLGTPDGAHALRGFVAGFSEARYRYSRYRAGAAVAPAELRVLHDAGPDTGRGDVDHDLAVAQVVEANVQWCRDLTNAPARDLTPVMLAGEVVREIVQEGTSVRVLDEAWLAAERFAGLVTVGAGSPNPPRLVEVTYRGAEAGDTPPIVLVGKGVTFDSGGLSLKRASAMAEMKSDMAGAATVLAAVRALAQLAPPHVHVIALTPWPRTSPARTRCAPGTSSVTGAA